MASHNRRGISHYRQLDCLLSALFRITTKKTTKLYITGFLWGELPVTSQRVGNAERVSMSWRHYMLRERTPECISVIIWICEIIAQLPKLAIVSQLCFCWVRKKTVVRSCWRLMTRVWHKAITCFSLWRCFLKKTWSTRLTSGREMMVVTNRPGRRSRQFSTWVTRHWIHSQMIFSCVVVDRYRLVWPVFFGVTPTLIKSCDYTNATKVRLNDIDRVDPLELIISEQKIITKLCAHLWNIR